MPKFNAYPAASRLLSTDILLKDTSGASGTQKITAAQMASDLAGMLSANQHRNTFRGRSLGSSVSSAQRTAIQNGTFDDIFIGDYWTIDSKIYLIADIDYWYQNGDASYFTKHHVVVVPQTNLYSTSMNDTNTVEGAYVNSKMRTTNLADALSTIQSAFGANLLTHREMLENAVTDGVASGSSWYDSTIDLMSETMIYGHRIASQNSRAAHMNSTSQLALFRLYPFAAGRSSGFWLRDVAGSTTFCAYLAYGASAVYNASDSRGVRPVFAVGV